VSAATPDTRASCRNAASLRHAAIHQGCNVRRKRHGRDAAYCSQEIREDSRSLGHVPLIDHNPRKGEKIEFAPHEALRYSERTVAERSNARLKDEFGGNQVMVRKTAESARLQHRLILENIFVGYLNFWSFARGSVVCRFCDKRLMLKRNSALETVWLRAIDPSPCQSPRRKTTDRAVASESQPGRCSSRVLRILTSKVL